MNNKAVETQRILLEQMKFRISKAISGPMSLNIKADVRYQELTDAMIMELRTNVMSESLQDTTQSVEFTFPSGVWQHFKQRWFPKWMKRRFPVKATEYTKNVTFQRMALYPSIPYSEHESYIHEIINFDTGFSELPLDGLIDLNGIYSRPKGDI